MTDIKNTKINCPPDNIGKNKEAGTTATQISTKRFVNPLLMPHTDDKRNPFLNTCFTAFRSNITDAAPSIITVCNWGDFSESMAFWYKSNISFS